ncbi:Pirin domain-containing protein [Candidatus Nitrosopumilus koreensis AR1]|uniref:Pirin domain-containing protein n=1 Tax=Candidatus Nitrosopumilus koreensis AR1 TaxID=1229908 RepID=K0B3M0_9ARCH|nr:MULTISPECIES: pirin family protein [Nitrosopumilus]AFS80688.1 Pirin domain-containing protein [Candidatus Nitrosopumilus koreensis AR1]
MSSSKKERIISEIITAKTTTEGDGFQVNRPFPNYAVRDFDPFLLLDEMGPVNYAPDEAKGASPHPHRGFETVTYMIDGAFEHKDSQGNSGKLFPGDVQWMTAGSGVIHSELPEKEFAKKGGRFHGLQLWVNLPKKEKMIPPRYQEISSNDIPVVKTDDGSVQVKIIAGESMGKKAVIDTKIPIIYLHFTLQPNATFIQNVPQNYNAFAYVIKGDAMFGNEKILAKQNQAVFFDQIGENIAISSDSDPTEVLLIAGVPINEPVKRYGPFVMNTDDELQQAVKDFQNGKMGKIDF